MLINFQYVQGVVFVFIDYDLVYFFQFFMCYGYGYLNVYFFIQGDYDYYDFF